VDDAPIRDEPDPCFKQISWTGRLELEQFPPKALTEKFSMLTGDSRKSLELHLIGVIAKLAGRAATWGLRREIAQDRKSIDSRIFK
jgi:hypothetical protein